MTPLRVLFAGTPDVAIPSLDLLARDTRFEVVAVLTNPDRARGRSGRPEPSPVAHRALELGLPVIQPDRPKDALGAITESGAVVGAVVAFGALLPEDVLAALPLGFVNLHFSILPRWRGAAPVQHAIRSGDATTGVSVFRIDRGMDTGPLLRTMEWPVIEGIDAGDLLEQLAREGAPILVDGLLALAAGEEPRAQPVEGVTLAPKLTSADAAVDWHREAEAVARLIRSVTPRPGAHTVLGDDRVKVAGVAVAADGSGEPPGTLIVVDDTLLVACGEGAVRLARIQFPGRPWSTVEEQLRGRRLRPGMRFGPFAGEDSP